MAKFYGAIGYAKMAEGKPQSWKEEIIERMTSGDLLENNRRLQESNNVNDNITLNNKISILSNPFALENFHSMRYVNYMGTNWKVIKVDVKYPKLILTLGGVYNGKPN